MLGCLLSPMQRLCAAALVSLVMCAPAVAELELRHSGGEVVLDDAAIDALPQATIETTTPYTDGVATFRGPLARDVVALASTDLPENAIFVAANDYQIEIPLVEFTRYDVILATHLNGERLSLRDKGPMWVMYPIDDHEELRGPEFVARLIWQLVRIDLR